MTAKYLSSDSSQGVASIRCTAQKLLRNMTMKSPIKSALAWPQMTSTIFGGNNILILACCLLTYLPLRKIYNLYREDGANSDRYSRKSFCGYLLCETRHYKMMPGYTDGSLAQMADMHFVNGEEWTFLMKHICKSVNCQFCHFFPSLTFILP